MGDEAESEKAEMRDVEEDYMTSGNKEETLTLELSKETFVSLIGSTIFSTERMFALTILLGSTPNHSLFFTILPTILCYISITSMFLLTDKTKQFLRYSPTHLLYEDSKFWRSYMVVAIVIIRLILLFNRFHKTFTCLVVLSDFIGFISLILESEVIRNTIIAIINAVYLPIKDKKSEKTEKGSTEAAYSKKNKKEEETTLEPTQENLYFVYIESIFFCIERIVAIFCITKSIQFSFYTIFSLFLCLISSMCILCLTNFNIQFLKSSQTNTFSEAIGLLISMATIIRLAMIIVGNYKTWIRVVFVSDVVGFISIILRLEGTYKIIMAFIQAVNPPIKALAEEERSIEGVNQTKEDGESNQVSSPTVELTQSNNGGCKEREEENEMIITKEQVVKVIPNPVTDQDCQELELVREYFEEEDYKRRLDQNLSLLALSLNEFQNNMNSKLEQVLMKQDKFNFEAETKDQLYETLSQKLQDTLYQWNEERNIYCSRLDDSTKQCAKQEELINQLEDKLREERLESLEEHDSMLLIKQKYTIDKNKIMGEDLEALKASLSSLENKYKELKLEIKSGFNNNKDRKIERDHHLEGEVLEVALKLSELFWSRLTDSEDKVLKLLNENETMEPAIWKQIVKQTEEETTALMDEKSKAMSHYEKKYCQALEEENKCLNAKLSAANKSCKYLGAILRHINSDGA